MLRASPPSSIHSLWKRITNTSITSLSQSQNTISFGDLSNFFISNRESRTVTAVAIVANRNNCTLWLVDTENAVNILPQSSDGFFVSRIMPTKDFQTLLQNYENAMKMLLLKARGVNVPLEVLKVAKIAIHDARVLFGLNDGNDVLRMLMMNTPIIVHKTLQWKGRVFSPVEMMHNVNAKELLEKAKRQKNVNVESTKLSRTLKKTFIESTRGFGPIPEENSSVITTPPKAKKNSSKPQETFVTPVRSNAATLAPTTVTYGRESEMAVTGTKIKLAPREKRAPRARGQKPRPKTRQPAARTLPAWR